MNFEESLREIESVEFDVVLNLASGLRLLFVIARQQEAVHTLWKELSLPTNQETLLARIKKLASEA